MVNKNFIEARRKSSSGLDNVLIHNMQLFNRNVKPVQLPLPGGGFHVTEGAFTMHDWWTIIALLLFVDLDNPSAIHRVESTSEILEVLQYSRKHGSEESIGKFDTKYFEALHESLHRLKTTPVYLSYNRLGEAGGGETSILAGFFYVYDTDEKEDPYSIRQVDVNKTDPVGDERIPPIFRRVDEAGRPIRYKAIEFAFSPFVVDGLKKDKSGRRIGFTPYLARLIELRDPLSKNPGAVKVIWWSLRQRSKPKVRRKLDTIAKWADFKNVPSRNRAKARDVLLLLEDLGFIENLVFEEETGFVEYSISTRWLELDAVEGDSTALT